MAPGRLVALALLASALPSTTSQLSDTCGICPGGNETGSVGSFPNAVLATATAPTGNAFMTYAALSVQGVTGQTDEREFLVNLGLVSDHGNVSRPTPYHDKVTLYVGVEGREGTGDIWAFNPLLTQAAGSGDYNAQGVELDFNNANGHRGEADAGSGLAPPVSYGFSITGAAPYRSTSAILVTGSGGEDRGRIWNRGIVFANDCVQQSTFQDLGSPDKSVDIRGDPVFGVYQSSPKSKNLFAGGTGVGLASAANFDADAALHVGLGGLRVDGPARFAGGMHPLLSSRPLLHETGTVTLDAAGTARVELTDVGADGSALAQLSYHLTPIGAPMPELHVAEEASAGGSMGGSSVAFKIGGGAPGRRVSWSITAGT